MGETKVISVGNGWLAFVFWTVVKGGSLLLRWRTCSAVYTLLKLLSAARGVADDHPCQVAGAVCHLSINLEVVEVLYTALFEPGKSCFSRPVVLLFWVEMYKET